MIYSNIFKTKSGATHHDQGKNRFQLEFGNVYMVFDFDGFLRFCAFIDQADKLGFEQLKAGPSDKIIVYPSKSSMCYAFDELEFIELQELVRGTRTILNLETEVQYLLS